MSRALGSLKLTDVVLLTGDAGGGLTDTDDLPEGSANLYYTNARVAAYLTGLTGTDDTSTFLRGDNAWSNTLIGDLGLQPPASGARNLTFTYPGDAQPIGLLTVTRGATADLDVVKVGRERRDTALYSSYLQFSDRAIFHAESPTIICNLQVDPTVGLGRVFVDANLLDASNANFGGGVNVGTATGAAVGQVKASAVTVDAGGTAGPNLLVTGTGSNPGIDLSRTGGGGTLRINTDGFASGTISIYTTGANNLALGANSTAILTLVSGGGLNVGSATGAGPGQVRASGVAKLGSNDSAVQGLAATVTSLAAGASGPVTQVPTNGYAWLLAKEVTSFGSMALIACQGGTTFTVVSAIAAVVNGPMVFAATATPTTGQIGVYGSGGVIYAKNGHGSLATGLIFYQLG